MLKKNNLLEDQLVLIILLFLVERPIKHHCILSLLFSILPFKTSICMSILLIKTHVCYLFGILSTYGSHFEVTQSFLITLRKIRELKRMDVC